MHNPRASSSKQCGDLTSGPLTTEHLEDKGPGGLGRVQRQVPLFKPNAASIPILLKADHLVKASRVAISTLQQIHWLFRDVDFPKHKPHFFRFEAVFQREQRRTWPSHLSWEFKGYLGTRLGLRPKPKVLLM